MEGLFLVLDAVKEAGSNKDVWSAFLPAIAAAIPGIITAIAQIKDKKYKNLTELVETSNRDNKEALDEHRQLIEEVKLKLDTQDEVDVLHKESLNTLFR